MVLPRPGPCCQGPIRCQTKALPETQGRQLGCWTVSLTPENLTNGTRRPQIAGDIRAMITVTDNQGTAPLREGGQSKAPTFPKRLTEEAPFLEGNVSVDSPRKPLVSVAFTVLESTSW